MPAIAVPNEEPRLEMLRESPDISPCCCSGKSRLNEVHRRRQHHAEAETYQKQSGRERQHSRGR